MERIRKLHMWMREVSTKDPGFLSLSPFIELMKCIQVLSDATYKCWCCRAYHTYAVVMDDERSLLDMIV